MSDLSDLFAAQDKTRRWRAERENASARYELALIEERCAMLISQYEPINSIGIDREKLRLVFRFLRNGNVNTLKE